jgi:hypothetical protein
MKLEACDTPTVCTPIQQLRRTRKSFESHMGLNHNIAELRFLLVVCLPLNDRDDHLTILYFSSARFVLPTCSKLVLSTCAS